MGVCGSKNGEKKYIDSMKPEEISKHQRLVPLVVRTFDAIFAK